MAGLAWAGCAPCSAEPGVLCVVAGTGATGFNGDGHKALQTDFYQVSAARRGPDGLLYVMDFNNHRLRRMTADGTVETVVGDGNHDFAIDGAAPTETPLENPVEFAFSPSGTLHLIMLHDPRVLQVKDGVVRVIAGSDAVGDTGDGGPARLAQFTQLTGIAFGADGSIYLADELANRVRKIGPDGVVVPFAGTGEPGFGGDGGPAVDAKLTEPRGLALGPEGSVYIADAGNHVIRRVRPDGIIETVAGRGGEHGFSGDGGPATSALLDRPRGVAVAADGVIFVADTNNDRVRRVDAEGIITTIAGTGVHGEDHANGDALEAELSAPSSVALDANGAKLLIAELGNSRVAEVGLR